MEPARKIAASYIAIYNLILVYFPCSYFKERLTTLLLHIYEVTFPVASYLQLQ